jgi:spore maturation protein CgeB
MLKKVDVFAPPENPYKTLHYMTEMLASALVKQGIQTRLFDNKIAKDPKKFIGMVISDPPDCTISFNGLLPDDEGNFLCDYIGIPHVAILVDSPQRFFSLVKSPYTIIGCIDQFHERFFKMFEGTHAFFLPHGVDAGIEADLDSKRPYDVTVLASFKDPDDIRKGWSEKYSSDICQILDEAADLTLERPQVSFIEAFSQCMKSPTAQKRVDPTKLIYKDLFSDLEDYVKALDRTETIHAIEDSEIHVFGDGDWDRFSSKTKAKIVTHGPITFYEAIEVMKESKIVLNCTPHIKYGGHERFFTAYMCGALPITALYPWLESQFKPKHEAVYYTPPNWGDMNNLVHTYLSDKAERQSVIENGMNITRENHTWDRRVETLMDNLPPILDILTN